MFRKKKKNFPDELFLHFSSKVQNLTVFSIIYMIRIRFFGPGELNQRTFPATRLFRRLDGGFATFRKRDGHSRKDVFLTFDVCTWEERAEKCCDLADGGWRRLRRVGKSASPKPHSRSTSSVAFDATQYDLWLASRPVQAGPQKIAEGCWATSA